MCAFCCGLEDFLGGSQSSQLQLAWLALNFGLVRWVMGSVGLSAVHLEEVALRSPTHISFALCTALSVLCSLSACVPPLSVSLCPLSYCHTSRVSPLPPPQGQDIGMQCLPQAFPSTCSLLLLTAPGFSRHHLQWSSLELCLLPFMLFFSFPLCYSTVWLSLTTGE